VTSRARRAAGWVVAAACLAYFAWHGGTGLPRQLGVDLWQPWGIERVREAVPGIGNPYADAPRHGDFLYAHARDGGSAKLALDAQFWARRSAICFEPTGTPFFYAALAFLPRDFDRAHALWALVLYALAGFAAYALSRLRGFARGSSAAIAAAVLAFFNPLYHDVTVANVNAVQLAALAAILRLLVRRPGGAVWNARLVPALLALLVVFKPNALPIAAMAMLHYLAVEPRRHWARDLALGALAGGAGVALGALHLGAPAWIDWWRYVNGMHGGTLLYSVAEGNEAPARMLAERFPMASVSAWSALLVAAFAAALAASIGALGRARDGAMRARLVLRDPGLAVSIGILALLAAAPLVWYHYDVFALLPMVWCARPRRPLDAATVLVLAAAVPYATPVLDLLGALHAPGIAAAAVHFAWLPVLAALLLRVAQAARGPAPGAAVANPAPERL
jgi:hypothetical protein